MKTVYLFTVLLSPHTWFELEELDDSTKKYIFWDEYPDKFLPSYSFFSFTETDHSKINLFRFRYRIRWSDLGKLKDINNAFEDDKLVDFHYLGTPLFYSEQKAFEYFSKVASISNFSEFKILSLHINEIYLNSIKEYNPNIYNRLTFSDAGLLESEVFGYDVLNAKDIGRNLRYHVSSIGKKYKYYENKNGLISTYDKCIEIIDSIDLEIVKASSSIINKNGESVPCYTTKEEWIPVIFKEVKRNNT